MKKNLINIILIISVIICTISCVPKEFQNDTFFTIAIGQRIQKYGIETEEKLSWHEGLQFTNPRWLFDVVISVIYDYVGFAGIYLFVMLFSSILMLFYYFVIYQLTHKKILSFLFTLAMIMPISGCFTGRALLISFNIFLIEFYCLEQITSQDDYKKYMIILLILPFILVNVHSSVYPVYFVIMLPYFAEHIAYIFLKDYQLRITIEKKKNIFPLIIVVLASLIAGFCVPYGTKPFIYMFKVTSGVSSEGIVELQNANILKTIPLTCLLVLALTLIGFTKIKIKLSDLLLIIGLFFLAVFAIRCLYFFYIISGICIAKLVAEFIEEYNIKFNIMDNQYQIIIFALLLLLILIQSISTIFYYLKTDYVELSKYPVDATEFILNNIDISKMKIFNSFNFGSYLEFKGIPVFIDSRSEVYTSDFVSGVSILEDWQNVIQGNVSYKKLFEEYQITHAILYNYEVINQYIVDDPEWEQIYRDDTFSIYEKISN